MLLFGLLLDNRVGSVICFLVTIHCHTFRFLVGYR